MTRPRTHTTLPDLAHRAAKARDCLLMTILSYDAETITGDEAIFAFFKIHGVAKQIAAEGEAPYPARVTGIDLEDYDDYDKPNEHLSKEED